MAVPPFDRSPLDGYALHSEDIAGCQLGSTPLRLQCDRRGLRGLRRGVPPCPGRGCARHDGCARARGAATALIRQEDTDEGMDWAEMYAPVGHGKNICLGGRGLDPSARGAWYMRERS